MDRSNCWLSISKELFLQKIFYAYEPKEQKIKCYNPARYHRNHSNALISKDIKGYIPGQDKSE